MDYFGTIVISGYCLPSVAMQRNLPVAGDAELRLTVDDDGRRLVFVTEDLESIAFAYSGT
ncbi:MAG: hypothetical protein ACOCR6_03260 [archaeon]